jgi:hypothetical protein
VGRCIDWLEKRTDIDPKRIAVSGSSMGGYYAARAGSCEHRLAACISHGAIWDIEKINTLIEKVSCKILIVEEHNAPGIILTRLIEGNRSVKNNIHCLFTSRNITQLVAKREDILKQQGLDSDSIIKKILNIFNIN